ncbi:hypothetical protein AAGW04_20425 [Pectobacterium aroidearum]|uniref:hypothetical protein n=1 Tax=Pectobacterium aroidearum TaxID=1201031 RepID=UPI003157FE29
MYDFNTKPFVSRLAILRRDDEFLQRSTTELIRIVSDIESTLMEATALMHLGIDTIDWGDFVLMTLNEKKIAWVARQVGEIIGLNLLPPVFIEKYLTEALNIGLSVDAVFWRCYFNKGLKDAAKVHESPNASIWLIDYYLYALSLDIKRNWYEGRTFY